ncbi:MAG: hypothetical protein HC881_18370 [Leptolyngbyaceae cyanobacterium SL_7_1]|nr:hypothetical protein [Leptolyngbyaceae cyanobacterium SL_7_1]
MASPSPSPLPPFADQHIWDSLKRAIAHSSGFQRWQLEHHSQLEALTLDQQVSHYLRQTLETLAY